MKRQLSDLTNDSNDSNDSNDPKILIPSEIDKNCVITEEYHAHPVEVTNEYRNDDLDITFVDNQFIDLMSDKKIRFSI